MKRVFAKYIFPYHIYKGLWENKRNGDNHNQDISPTYTIIYIIQIYKKGLL